MKFLLRFLGLFALGIVIALGAQFTQGQVLLVWPPYRVELSLNLALLLWIGSWVGFYVLMRLIAATIRLPRQVAAFRTNQRYQKEQNALQGALLAVVEGRYHQARQLADKISDLSSNRGIARLVAAYAALQARDYDATSRYLSALEEEADFQVAKTVLAAEAALDQQQPELAWQSLEQLKARVGLHGTALRLELKALQASQQWLRIPPVLKELQKREVLDEQQIDQLRWAVQAEALRSLAEDRQGLEVFWKTVTSRDRQQYRVALAAIQSFLKVGENALARNILEQTLAEVWYSDLLPYYLEGMTHDAPARLEQAERWLQKHPQDAKLLFVLGQLCARQELWGKANQYLEASLSLEETYSVHLALGEMYERQEHPEAASKHYIAALQLAVLQLQAASGDRRRLVW